MIETNEKRMRQQLCELARLAETSQGICRLAYSASFWKSNEYLKEIMVQAGMDVTTNPVGNVVGAYAGKCGKKITLGSHVDSVVNGGMFDGCLGVIAGIEVVRTLHENGIRPAHTIEVVAFAEEEGLVIAGLVGSRAYCGLPPTSTMLKKMESHGITPQSFADAKTNLLPEYALELHIEQGGALENRKIPIGVVSAIIALRRYTVEFSGIANHAGTTPMNLREDALIKAAAFIQRCRTVVMEIDAEMVGTVGQIEVEPNAMNTVPGRVSLTLELRALNEHSIEGAYQRLMEEFREDIVHAQLTMQQPSFPMDKEVRTAIHTACGTMGLAAVDMGSGAGHDSMSLAQVAKTGMIFVPSVGGISHSGEEKTKWSDVKNGADVLLHTLLLLDQGPIEKRKEAIADESEGFHH